MERGRALYGRCYYVWGVERALGTSWPEPPGPAWTAEALQMNMAYCILCICHSLVYFRHTKKRLLARKFSVAGGLKR